LPGAAPPPPTVASELGKLVEAITDINNLKPVDYFLHQLDPDTFINVQDYGTGAAKVSLLQVSNYVFTLSPELEAQIKALADTNGTAIDAIESDLSKIDNLQTALSEAPLLSTYQGRYAAGLLTNLTSLPATLAGNWNATFRTTPLSTQWTSTAGAYDLKTPVPALPDHSQDTVDQTNRGGVAPSSATATSNLAPRASSPVCNVALATGSTSQAACPDQAASVLDEGRSHWDVSVVVPLLGYQDVTFQAGTAATGSTSSTPNVITSKTVTRENAYGVFDLFLIKEDLLNPPYVGIPHVVVGLPFAGKVFDKPYFAVGETLNFSKAIAKVPFLTKIPVINSLAQSDLPLSVRPVFGWVYNKEFPAASTGNMQPYRSLKPQWAIELSFSSIKNAVQTFSKSSGSGTGSTPKTTTPSTVPSTN
jgi:hypothetical protein